MAAVPITVKVLGAARSRPLDSREH